MSLPKKGSRQIVVGDSTYRWMIRRKPTYSAGLAESNMRVVIQLDSGEATSVLLVETDQPRPDNWLTHKGPAVTPGHVAAMIDLALAAGWQPASTRPSSLRYTMADPCGSP